MRLLLATNNPHKAAELAAIFSDMEGIRAVSLADLPEAPPEPEEDGDTLEANAYIKAFETFTATGIPTVADDTGLEVAALDGAPGVHSARWAGPGATYADNCARLLKELAGRDAANRRARFRTVICYVDGLRTLFAEGSVEGEIVDEPRGDAGFGYDPLFRPLESERTFAEMDAAEKNRISHRARAVVAMRGVLAPYVEEGR